MKSISTLALVLSLVLTGASATSAVAQKKGKQAAAPVVDPGARKFNVSKEARNPLFELQQAVVARDAANFAARLAAAEAVAKSADEKYMVARLRFDYASATGDTQAQTAAMESILASGGAVSADLVAYNQRLGQHYFNTNRFDAAAAAFARLAELQPNDADVFANYALVRSRQNKPAESLQLLDRAIAIKTASGQPVPEPWYRRVVDASTRAKNLPVASKTTYDWLSAYPTKANWRDALLIQQQMVRMDSAGEFDRLRLMRQAGVLEGERDYGEYAQIALDAGLPGEAKAVLEEGVRKRIVDGSKPLYRDLLRRASEGSSRDRSLLAGYEAKATASATGTLAMTSADAFLGYGEYAKAATLYRLALSKGGVDANLVNTRLGQALAASGDKAGATSAFAAVTGPRQDLARYWTLWLTRPAPTS